MSDDYVSLIDLITFFPFPMRFSIFPAWVDIFFVGQQISNWTEICIHENMYGRLGVRLRYNTVQWLNMKEEFNLSLHLPKNYLIELELRKQKRSR